MNIKHRRPFPERIEGYAAHPRPEPETQQGTIIMHDTVLMMHDIVLIWSDVHKAWWRPDGRGYTTVRDNAGRYFFGDALGIRTRNFRPEELVFHRAARDEEIIPKP